jgi:hypothetical protein
MHKGVCILIVELILILNSHQQLIVVVPQTEVILVDGTSFYRSNIPSDKLIPNCAAYDYRLAKATPQVIK